jgi:hypothetical protein
MARSQTDGHDRLLGVDSLSEQVRGQWERTDRVEHDGTESCAYQVAALATTEAIDN